MASKDEFECNCMNEMFGKDEPEELPRYHWVPVAIYDSDDKKIRDLTREEQLAWLKKRIQMDER